MPTRPAVPAVAALVPSVSLVPSVVSLAYRRAGQLRSGMRLSPEADPGTGGSGSSGNSGGSGGASGGTGSEGSADRGRGEFTRAQAQRFLDRFDGDPVRAVTAALREKHKAEARRDEAVQALDRAKVPEGGRAISREDAAEFDAFKALGTAKAVKATLDGAKDAATRLAAHETAQASTSAATALGLNPKALGTVLADKGLTPVAKDVPTRQQDGTTRTERQYYVTTTAADGTTSERLLADVIRTDLSVYLPSLTAPVADAETASPESGTPAPAWGTPSATEPAAAPGVVWNPQLPSASPARPEAAAAKLATAAMAGFQSPGQRAAKR